MSSSAPRQQPLAESSPFAYAEAGDPGGAPAVPLETGHGTDERNLQRAEIFEQGRQSGQQELRSGLDAALARNRDQISRSLSQFVLERQSYYRRVEGEVVELALAIARKILHREVQIDPNTLAGIVRVTLEKLDTGTKVDLHVHPQEAAAWRHYFACETQDVEPPGIHEDPAIARGECRINTSLGSTEIGLESQLKEIETGLLDLLAERPGAPPRPALAPATRPVPPNSLTNADTAGQT
jgi:flagellar assembly protein FliH